MVQIQSVKFKVSKKGTLKSTSKDNLYLECDTDREKIAIWGSNNNLNNISKVQNVNEPFQLISDRYVNPSWQQHSYWIPESATVQII